MLVPRTHRITQAYLKSRLHYEPETGDWTWVSSPRAGWAGKKANHVNQQGYVLISIDGISYKAHRLAVLYVTGVMPPDDVDHKDGVGVHNTYGNLRPADRPQNTSNTKKPCTNTSGHKGVYPNKKNGTWIAQIAHNGKQHYLGSFLTIEEAAEAVRVKREELHGEFANHGEAGTPTVDLSIAAAKRGVANRKQHKNNTSGIKGVSRGNGGWVANISRNKKNYHLGTFSSIEEAAEAVRIKREELDNVHG